MSHTCVVSDSAPIQSDFGMKYKGRKEDQRRNWKTGCNSRVREEEGPEAELPGLQTSWILGLRRVPDEGNQVNGDSLSCG